MHPQPEMEVWLGRAYNRWLIDRILAADDRIKTLLFLPVQHAGRGRARRQGFRRPQGRDRLLHPVDALQAGARQRLHAALRDDRGDRQAGRVPRRLSLAGSVARHRQPLPRHACAGLRLVQHGAHDQLDPQRAARAFPQAQGDLDRERARLGALPDAAPRRPVPDASLRGSAAQADAQRVHEPIASIRRSRWRRRIRRRWKTPWR